MYLSKLRSEGEALPEYLPERIRSQVSGSANRPEMVSVDEYSVVVTLVRKSFGPGGNEQLYQKNKDFFEEIKNDFSAIAEATTPRRHL